MAHEETGTRKKFGDYVSVSNLLTLLAMCGALAATWNAMSGDLKATQTRVEAMEKRENDTKDRINEAKNDLKAEIKEVKTDVKDLNRKIDFLIEKSMQKGNGR